MYIIAVGDINDNIVQVAQAEDERTAEKIHNNICYRYNFTTFTYHNTMQRWAMRSSGGSKKYNGVDKLDISDYIVPTQQPKELTIQDYKDMIFAIEMQDFIPQEDYDLIYKYKEKIKELSEVE